MTTPLFAVDEPTIESAGYGLYSAATVLDPDTPHARSGAWWEPSFCGVPTAFPLGCPQPAVFPITVPEGVPVVQQFPFGVVAGIRCKPVGTPLERLREIARTRLRLAEQFAVERTYWTGLAGGTALDPGSPRLNAGAGVTVLAGAPVKPSYAMGLLEEALGGMSGVVGVIHAPRVAFGALKSHVAEARGGMRTELGTKVVFGTGYTGSAPDGTARTGETAWLYATGPVQVVRGRVTDLPGTLSDALDRSTNVATVQAVRIVSVGHACGLVAVPVNLTA